MGQGEAMTDEAKDQSLGELAIATLDDDLRKTVSLVHPDSVATACLTVLLSIQLIRSIQRLDESLTCEFNRLRDTMKYS